MDLAPLRALARDVEFAVHGVPATVGGVSTRVVWLTESTDQVPATNELQRASARRGLAIRRDDVPVAPPRGTLVETQAHGFVAASNWLVDSVEEVFADHVRVLVVPAYGQGLVRKALAWYRLDETSGTREDSSPDSLDLRDVNTVGYEPGVIGNAASYVRTRQERLESDGSLTLDPSRGFTWSTWIKPVDESPFDQSYVSIGTPLTDWFLRQLVVAAGTALWQIRDGGGAIIGSGGVPTTYGVWQFLCGWYDPLTRTCQIQKNDDAPVIGPFVGDGDFSSATGRQLVLGREAAGSYNCTGAQDLTGVFAGVLAEEERAHLFNAGSGRDWPF